MPKKKFYEVLRAFMVDPDSQNNFTHPFFKLLKHLEEFETRHSDVCKHLYVKTKCKKGDILVHVGDCSNKFFFVESGIIRSFSMINDKERTVQITLPGEFSGTYSNSVLNLPSDVTIEVLSKSIVWVFDWNVWNDYKIEYPLLGLFEQFNSASYIMFLNERVNDLLFLTSFERYEKLLHKRSQFVKNLPLRYVADYIGSSVENLSRIRKMLLK